jgi:hypothetical protein
VNCINSNNGRSYNTRINVKSKRTHCVFEFPYENVEFIYFLCVLEYVYLLRVKYSIKGELDGGVEKSMLGYVTKAVLIFIL